MPLPITAEEKNILTHQVYSLFTRYGFDSISMNEVARQIGLSKATLYKYFNSKEDIVRDMVNEITAQLKTPEFTAEAGLEGVLESLSDIYCRAVIVAAYSSSKFTTDLKNSYPDMYSDLTAALDDIQKRFENFYEKAVRKGYCREISTRLVGEQTMQMLPVIITPAYLDTHDVTLSEILKEYYKLLLCLLLDGKYETVTRQENTYTFVNIVVDVLKDRFLIRQPL